MDRLSEARHKLPKNGKKVVTAPSTESLSTMMLEDVGEPETSPFEDLPPEVVENIFVRPIISLFALLNSLQRHLQAPNLWVLQLVHYPDFLVFAKLLFFHYNSCSCS